jgi:hypothetical protein
MAEVSVGLNDHRSIRSVPAAERAIRARSRRRMRCIGTSARIAGMPALVIPLKYLAPILGGKVRAGAGAR